MKKITIENQTYTLKPISPGYSTYSTLVSNLMRQGAKNVAEAKTLTKEISDAVDVLFKEFVQPNVNPEHRTFVFNALMDYTNEVIKQAESFRKTK